MSLSPKEMADLKKIIQLADQLIKKAGQSEKTKPTARRAVAAPTARKVAAAPTSRRSGKELIAFREKLRAEREAGTPVTKIAKKYGISPSYIYQLG